MPQKKKKGGEGDKSIEFIISFSLSLYHLLFFFLYFLEQSKKQKQKKKQRFWFSHHFVYPDNAGQYGWIILKKFFLGWSSKEKRLFVLFLFLFLLLFPPGFLRVIGLKQFKLFNNGRTGLLIALIALTTNFFLNKQKKIFGMREFFFWNVIFFSIKFPPFSFILKKKKKKKEFTSWETSRCNAHNTR